MSLIKRKAWLRTFEKNFRILISRHQLMAVSIYSTEALMYLLTVIFSLVSIDVVVLVGGDPLSGCVLDTGLVLALRHP